MNAKTVLVTAPHLSDAAQEILRSAGWTIVFLPEACDEAMLIEAVAKNNPQALLLRGSKPITRGVLSAGEALKLIAKNGVGVDSVNVEAAKELGIAVKTAVGANADAVAEQALAMMLALTRNLSGLTRKIQSGGWEGTGYQGRDFRGSVVGIVGYGDIGRRTAQMARALGANVMVHRPSSEQCADDFETVKSLQELLPLIDILSLHCPLKPQTRHMIGAEQLALLKASSFLVNTARGGLIDEPALLQALQNGTIAGAGLDCFETEPLPLDSPWRQLENRHNVILAPHVAGVTKQSVFNVSTTTATNIVNFFFERT